MIEEAWAELRNSLSDKTCKAAQLTVGRLRLSYEIKSLTVYGRGENLRGFF
jgi:hypothetical protein